MAGDSSARRPAAPRRSYAAVHGTPPAAPFRFQPLRTLRFGLLVGAGFTLLTFALSAGHPSWHTAEGWLRAFGMNLVFALLISFTISLLHALGDRLLGARYAPLLPTDYLRASLVCLREPEHSLGDELDLVNGYLRVVEVRMDDRLRYRIDVPAELRAMRVPALSLQPLVGNAVVHGLEPSIDGGQIVVAARVERGRLVVRVADDGVGLGAAPRAARPGSGNALNKLRERLTQTHAGLPALTLEAARPHGVLATLTLPAGGQS